MATHQRVPHERHPMSTNTKGFDAFHKQLRSCAMDENSLSIGRVKAWLRHKKQSIIVYADNTVTDSINDDMK